MGFEQAWLIGFRLPPLRAVVVPALRASGNLVFTAAIRCGREAAGDRQGGPGTFRSSRRPAAARCRPERAVSQVAAAAGGLDRIVASFGSACSHSARGFTDLRSGQRASDLLSRSSARGQSTPARPWVPTTAHTPPSKSDEAEGNSRCPLSVVVCSKPRSLNGRQTTHDGPRTRPRQEPHVFTQATSPPPSAPVALARARAGDVRLARALVICLALITPWSSGQTDGPQLGCPQEASPSRRPHGCIGLAHPPPVAFLNVLAHRDPTEQELADWKAGSPDTSLPLWAELLVALRRANVGPVSAAASRPVPTASGPAPDEHIASLLGEVQHAGPLGIGMGALHRVYLQKAMSLGVSSRERRRRSGRALGLLLARIGPCCGIERTAFGLGPPGTPGGHPNQASLACRAGCDCDGRGGRLPPARDRAARRRRSPAVARNLGRGRRTGAADAPRPSPSFTKDG